MYTFKAFKIRFKGKLLLSSPDFSLPKTGFVALTGEVGSGKSTILKRLYKGKLKTTGKGSSFKDACCYLSSTPVYLEGDSGFDHLGRVKENIAFDQDCFMKLASKLLINNLLKKSIATYSAGEKARFFFAVTIATSRPIVLLDEPTANLDEETSNLLIEQIKELAKERLVIVASHDSALIDCSSDRLKILDKRLEVGVKILPEIDSIKMVKRHRPRRHHLKMAMQVVLFSCFALGGVGLSATHFVASEYLNPNKKNYEFSLLDGKDYYLARPDKIYASTHPYLEEFEYFYSYDNFFQGWIIDQEISFKDLKKEIPFLRSVIHAARSDEIYASKITSKLYSVLKSLYGSFELKDLFILGLECDEIVKSEAVAVYLPQAVVYNYIPKLSYGRQMNSLVYDKDGNSIVLQEGEMAVKASEFESLYGTKQSVYGEKYLVNSFFVGYPNDYVLPTEMSEKNF